MIVKPTVENLAEAARAGGARGKPPVHLWNPPYSGDMDMQILRDGTWVHEGGAIRRMGLVKLFASILRKDGDGYVLVTPVEKWGITVEDAPFVALDFEVTGEGTAQSITFFTNVEDATTADADHPIRVEQDPETGEPAPYVMVRDGLEARMDRKSFYRLIELGEHAPHAGESWFGIWSGGVFFPLIRSTEVAG